MGKVVAHNGSKSCFIRELNSCYRSKKIIRIIFCFVIPILMAFIAIQPEAQSGKKEKTYCNPRKNEKTVTVTVGEFTVAINKEWKHKPGNENSSAMFVKRRGTAIISISMMKPLPEEINFLDAVKYFRNAGIDAGKTPVSAVKKIINCSGETGYMFAFRNIVGKRKKIYEWNVFFRSDEGSLCQVIFTSLAKKNISKYKYRRIIKNIKSSH